MTYTVLVRFKDLQDNRHVYNVGDKFPRVGLSVSDARIEELSTTKNRRGVRLIKSVPEEDTSRNAPPLTEEVPQEVHTGESPSKQSEAKEKPKKTPRRGTGSKKNARTDS